MLKTLPDGAFVLPADVEKIEGALADLEKSKSANGSIQITVRLHTHYEYPKHVTVGGETVVVQSEAEEDAALEQNARLEQAAAAATAATSGANQGVQGQAQQQSAPTAQPAPIPAQSSPSQEQPQSATGAALASPASKDA